MGGVGFHHAAVGSKEGLSAFGGIVPIVSFRGEGSEGSDKLGLIVGLGKISRHHHHNRQQPYSVGLEQWRSIHTKEIYVDSLVLYVPPCIIPQGPGNSSNSLKPPQIPHDTYGKPDNLELINSEFKQLRYYSIIILSTSMIHVVLFRSHHNNCLPLYPPYLFSPLVVIRTRRYLRSLLIRNSYFIALLFFPSSTTPRTNSPACFAASHLHSFFFSSLRDWTPYSILLLPPGLLDLHCLLPVYPPARLRVQPTACSNGRDPSSPAWRVARPRRIPPPLGTPATSYVVMIFKRLDYLNLVPLLTLF